MVRKSSRSIQNRDRLRNRKTLDEDDEKVHLSEPPEQIDAELHEPHNRKHQYPTNYSNVLTHISNIPGHSWISLAQALYKTTTPQQKVQITACEAGRNRHLNRKPRPLLAKLGEIGTKLEMVHRAKQLKNDKNQTRMKKVGI